MIICPLCNSEKQKENVLEHDVFISFTCTNCKKNIFDLRRNCSLKTEFTIENFVDGVNEVLLQLTNNKVVYDKIQDSLLKYLKGESDIDGFCFEFTCIIKEEL